MRFIGLALLLVIPGMLRDVVSVAVSWSTVMLFGKVPRTREPYVFVMSIGATSWIVAVMSVAVPPVGEFLLGFLPIPEPLDGLIVWYIMLTLVVAIPPLVAVAIVRALDADNQPRGRASLVGMILKGYPFVLSLAFVLVMMSGLRLLTLLRNRGRGWTERHVPLIVQPRDYDTVLDDIRKVLVRGDFAARMTDVGWPLIIPTRILTFAGGIAVRDLLTDRPMALMSERLEAVLHLSDLVLRGHETDVNRARALLGEQLAFSPAYLTWSKQANEIEDRLRSIWQEVKGGAERSIDSTMIDRLEVIEGALRTADLSYDEWEVLMREKLLVERSLLHVAMGLIREPLDLTETAPEAMGAAQMHGVADGSATPRMAAVARLRERS